MAIAQGQGSPTTSASLQFDIALAMLILFEMQSFLEFRRMAGNEADKLIDIRRELSVGTSQLATEEYLEYPDHIAAGQKHGVGFGDGLGDIVVLSSLKAIALDLITAKPHNAGNPP
jgi:hypothetical protein